MSLPAFCLANKGNLRGELLHFSTIILLDLFAALQGTAPKFFPHSFAHILAVSHAPSVQQYRQERIPSNHLFRLPLTLNATIFQTLKHAAEIKCSIIIIIIGSSLPLSPTFQGHIASTQDALLLFEACLSGHLNHVARRPYDHERASLIKSGNVFIYQEHSSGIKRWTDGVPWSPSRILGNFLVYRELERPFPPGEKKRAIKRNKRSPGISKAQDPYDRSSGGAVSSTFGQAGSDAISKETERSLIGSLVDSYGFKDDGLVKKTISVTVGGVSYHLVSYYFVADVTNDKFTNPSKDPRFNSLITRQDLITKQNFRTPIDEVDSMDASDPSAYENYSYPQSGYQLMPLPTSPLTYGSRWSVYHSHSIAISSACTGYGNQFALSPSIYLASKTDAPNHHPTLHSDPDRTKTITTQQTV